MKIQKLKQDGFHIIGLILVGIVIGVIGFAGYRVVNSKDKPRSSQSPQQATPKSADEPVKWAFNEKELKWYPQTGTPPACKEPFVFDKSPVDLSKIMVIGMPGSYRGYNYKPHGGLRLIDANSGKIDIKMPADAKLVGLTRYYEGNPAELQYLLDFVNDCGIAFRFDHIYTLTPALQKIAEKTPKPKINDTSRDPNISFTPVTMKAGELIATEVGFPRIKNFGFDFGVYDYRQRNDISKNQKWAAVHNQYQSLEWFGACWINQLPGADAAAAKKLSLTVINPARPNIISDYCTYAPHNTLDFSNGQPTDG